MDKSKSPVNSETSLDKKTIFRISKGKENPYFMILKSTVQNAELSWKARAILAYLLSLPDDWQLSFEELLKHTPDGRDSTRAGLKELKKFGYLSSYQERNKDGSFGRYITNVFEVPVDKYNVLEGEGSFSPFPACVNDVSNLSTKDKKVDKLSTEGGNVDKLSTETTPIAGLPLPEKPSAVLTILNTDVTKETTTKGINTNRACAQERAPDVVVFLMKKLERIHIKEELVKELVNRYGFEAVNEKIDYTMSSYRDSPVGFLKEALKNDWKPYRRHVSITQGEKTPQLASWPSLEANKSWYLSLSREERQKCVDLALINHPYLVKLVQTHDKEVSLISDEFVNNTWFRVMMIDIGRSRSTDQ